MAAAVRGSPGTRCFIHYLNSSSGVRHLVRGHANAYNVGYWFPTSSYHSGATSQRSRWTHCGGSSKLLVGQLTVLQLPSQLSRTSLRHNSSASSILHKIFFVKAASPLPDEEIVDSNGVKADSLDATTYSVYNTAAPVNSVTDDTSAAAFQSVADAGESVAASQNTIDSITYILPPPVPPEAVGPALNALGEPTFASLGLGGWSPVGIVQSSLEFLHVTADLPWWGAIALVTVAIRTLVFPLVLKAQRNAAKMNNNLPQLQILQIKMTEARNCGDQLNAARYSQEMVEFMKEKEINPMKNLIVPLAQAPVFISVFLALRRLANLPLDSFQTGGLFWFMDLNVCDPYYLLPVITSLTMLATIELGADGAKLSSQNMHLMKYFLRLLPFLIFPFTMNFPAAVLCYWVSTNVFSLIQVGFLKIPAVRNYFKIEASIHHKKETLPQQNKGMVEGFKESWKNMKITREIAERESYDEMRFKKAGAGPIVRTYKHNPVKNVINVQAKVKSR
ncbi:mitochondrial inner membrane protein OXA1L isoform X1 [Cherax quadricarinatus]